MSVQDVIKKSVLESGVFDKFENGRQQEKEPTLFYEAWCEIRNLYGQELYEALDVRLENAIVFEVRYCRRIKEIKAHAKDFLIEFEGDRYDI